ncbi:MAG: PAS domain S-box protein [Dehalococcoidia bacterium]|nr:PAS domain S-box protein [Dehalococcoidia bacterium]
MQVTRSNFMDVISDRTDVLRILPEAAAELCTALFRNSPAGIYITRDGKFIYTNIEFRHITGYSQDELSGKDYQRLINPRYRQKPKQNIASFFEEDEGTSHEFKITTREGKQRWIAEKITYFKYGGNWLTLGHWLDITEHHSVEKAWREAERRFQLAFEDLSTGLTIISMENIFLKVNKSFCDMVGYEEREILESRYDDMLPAKEREASGDIMSLFLSLDKPELPVQRQLIARDGRIIWVAMSISLIGDNEAGPSYFIVHFQDITEQKRIEEGLKEEERLYRQVVDLSLEPVAITDLDCHITHTSGKLLLMLGCKKEDLLGNSLASLIPHSQPRDIQASIMDCVSNKQQKEIEITLQRKDGSELPCRMRIAWIDNELGTPTCLILSFRVDDAQEEHPFVDVAPETQPATSVREKSAQPAMPFDIAPTAAMLINQDTTIAAINTGFEVLSGYSKEEIEGKKSWIEFVAGDDQPRLKRYHLMRQIDSESAPSTFDFKLVCRDGSTRDVVVYMSPVQDTGQLSATLIDLATHRKAEIAEKEAQDEEIGYLRQTGERVVRSLEQLHKTVRDIVAAMARIIEMRDPYTAGHQERVAKLAVAIAGAVGMSEEQLEGIEIAAKIHDIGKVYVPMEILSKPGTLTAIERQIIQTHAQGSYEMLKPVEFPWPVAEVSLQHHERLDGSGYPRGLKGDDICIDARILMVADVVEAMASPRPYRPSLGIEAALQEISENAGVLYDEDVTAICLSLFREKDFSF